MELGEFQEVPVSFDIQNFRSYSLRKFDEFRERPISIHLNRREKQLFFAKLKTLHTLLHLRKILTVT